MTQRENLINKAIELKKNQKFEEALQILEKLLQEESPSGEIKKILIEVLLDYGGNLNDEWVLGYEKAAECFKRIVELDPINYRAWYNLGIAYFNLNKTEEALKAYNQAIKLKSDYMYCYYNIGLLYETHKGELELALQYYEKALSYNENFTYALQACRDVRQKLEVIKLKNSMDKTKNIETHVICQNCGNFNRIGAKFCDKCGEQI